LGKKTAPASNFAETLAARVSLSPCGVMPITAMLFVLNEAGPRPLVFDQKSGVGVPLAKLKHGILEIRIVDTPAPKIE
jgi:hypothetical protein